MTACLAVMGLFPCPSSATRDLDMFSEPLSLSRECSAGHRLYSDRRWQSRARGPGSLRASRVDAPPALRHRGTVAERRRPTVTGTVNTVLY